MLKVQFIETIITYLNKKFNFKLKSSKNNKNIPIMTKNTTNHVEICEKYGMILHKRFEMGKEKTILRGRDRIWVSRKDKCKTS